MNKRQISIAIFGSLAILVACSGNAATVGTISGPTGTISGRVVDARGTPVGNVPVEVKGTALSARTGADGTFELQYVPGSFVVRFASPEVVPLERALTLTQYGALPLGNVEVVRLPARVSDVVVAQSAGYVEIPAVEVTESVRSCPNEGFAAGGRWQVWRPTLPRDLPILYGPALQAFVPDVPAANWNVVTVSEEGVLGAQFVRTSLLGPCAASFRVGAGVLGLTWTGTEDRARYSIAAERLASNRYCIVQGAMDSERRLTTRPEQARCFEWRTEAPTRFQASVTAATGLAGIQAGQACDVSVERAEFRSQWACRTRVSCDATVVYGGDRGGLVPCEIALDPIRIVGTDADPTSGDSDPRLSIDTVHGTLTVSDDAIGSQPARQLTATLRTAQR